MEFKSLNDAAYSVIRTKILQGEFELGSRIREDVLAEQITISRTPVREAINRLVADGIIIKKPQCGLYLIDPEPAQIAEHIDIRISLETLAIEKCIEWLDDAGLSVLENSLKAFKKALDEKNYAECNELDSEFHMLIAKLSRNSRLMTLLDDFSTFFQLIRREEKKRNPEEKNRMTMNEHRLIIDAIKDRDTEGAKTAIKCNIERMRSSLLNNEE